MIRGLSLRGASGESLYVFLIGNQPAIASCGWHCSPFVEHLSDLLRKLLYVERLLDKAITAPL